MTKEDLTNITIALPKWPQCIIRGKSITKEQALEIIRRTDTFFITGIGGNNHLFNEAALKIIEKPIYNKYDNYDDYIRDKNMWNKRWGVVNLHYLSNDWVSTASIDGPNGWCHPDGTIEFHYNIGKWPNIETVYDELKRIGDTFPFLELTLTLMSDEDCCSDNSVPLISFSLKNKEITIVSLSKKDLFYESTSIDFNKLLNRNDYSNECYFSLAQIRNWADGILEEDDYI